MTSRCKWEGDERTDLLGHGEDVEAYDEGMHLATCHESVCLHVRWAVAGVAHAEDIPAVPIHLAVLIDAHVAVLIDGLLGQEVRARGAAAGAPDGSSPFDGANDIALVRRRDSSGGLPSVYTQGTRVRHTRPRARAA